MHKVFFNELFSLFGICNIWDINNLLTALIVGTINNLLFFIIFIFSKKTPTTLYLSLSWKNCETYLFGTCPDIKCIPIFV